MLDINKYAAASGRRIKEDGELVNIADKIDALYNALVVNKNAGVSLTGSNAKEPFTGSSNTTKTFTQSMNGFVISNDGASDLTFTIADDTFIVKAGEVFKENFSPFTQVTITTSVAFRAYGLGV